MTLPDLVAFSVTLTDLAEISQLRTLSSIKSLFAFGHRIGYLPYDVGRALRLPKVRDQLSERILPEADVHRMLSLEENPRNRALLTLLYASGIRVGELCGLRWQHVSATSDGGQITVLGKGTKTRSIRLPASVWKLLMALPQELTDLDPHPEAFAGRRQRVEKGQLKDRQKIERRLGRIQARHPQVSGRYQMNLTEREDRLAVEWQLIEERRAWREAREGTYLLRTNLEGESAEELWMKY